MSTKGPHTTSFGGGKEQTGRGDGGGAGINFFDDFSDGRLDPERWLVSAKAWGGDNGGVAPANVTLVEDVDEGRPIIALRLEAHGDLYSGDLVHNGRRTRVGAAIATRTYHASGRYEVRARIAPEFGTCTAFWPFHYIDY